ncbi:TonB-dependent receptor [Phenylobacterium sp.]|uniref:TonB-dependent receptor domain-containing protein n=1 Tax=Phenylobacterium sp. TaxID=1871053 RepID=UPI0025EACF56|nr:TonB-dependent receptor [Phenylobacterium sp.]
MNIILRRDFDGAETRLLGGVGTAGEPAEVQLSQTLGRRWPGGGFILSYELRRRENLPSSARSYAADADLRALGGSDQRIPQAFPGNVLVTDPTTGALTPGFAIPGGQDGTHLSPGDFAAGAVNFQNQRQGVDILPKQTLNSVYLAAHQAVGARLELTADARFSQRRYRNRQPAPTGTLTVGRGNPYFVSPNGAASNRIAYSFANDLPTPLAYGTAETLALSIGADARLGRGWRAQGYAAFAQGIEEARGGGILNSIILNEALGNTPDNPATAYSPAADGYFNPFSGLPGANAALGGYIGSGFAFARGRDRVTSANLQADGPLLSLPGGAVKLALGVQARREAFQRRNTVYVTAAPMEISHLDLSRTVGAAFGELQVPIVGPGNARPGLARLEVSLSGRVEHYESFGTTANPKVGVLWSPADGLNLRATYGRAFRAPNLREVADPESYTPGLLAYGGGRVVTLTLSGGNPDLEPETARSWTLGFDLRPRGVPGLSLSATAFDVRFRNRIGQAVSANLANALQDPTLSSFVTRISPGTSAADLALIQGLLASPYVSGLAGTYPAEAYGAIVDNRYVNTASLRVRGIDVSAAYRFALGQDDVRLGAEASYMATYKQRLTPTSPVVERVNTMNFPVRFRSRVTADWTRGPLTLGAAFNYTVAYRDALGVRIGDQPTFDLQARWAGPRQGPLQGVALLLNVRNLFDRDPPFYDNTLGIGYDGAQGDPIGRFVSLQLTRAW